jgi:membrane protease YdiL (CAAX protease family)
MVAVYLLGWFRDPAGSIESHFWREAGVYAVALNGLFGAFVLAALRRGPKLFGLCMPTGLEWLFLLPGALVGGVAGGAWIYSTPATISQAFLKYDWSALAIAFTFPIAAEGIFRGLVHGRLAQHFPIQHSSGHWFVSWPIVLSSLLYVLWSSLPFLPFFSRGVGLTFVGALLFGVSSGMARERSESLLPCLILHWSCLLLLVMMSFF